MNIKIVGGIAVVAIVFIAGGWYLMSQPVAAPVSSTSNTSEDASQTVASTTEPAPGAEATTTATTTSTSIGATAGLNGTWRSTEDAKFTRAFNADGTFVDAYVGEPAATEKGTYSVVDPLKEPAGAFGTASASSLTGMTVLKLTFPRSGALYFSVQSKTAASLELINIGRGNVLTFTKVQ